MLIAVVWLVLGMIAAGWFLLSRSHTLQSRYDPYWNSTVVIIVVVAFLFGPISIVAFAVIVVLLYIVDLDR